MQRFAVLGALGAFLFAVPAWAGGWAATTLDSLPSTVQAGQEYSIGYTIRQHGVSPYNQATPSIQVRQGNQQLTFTGKRDGDGHYVSTVQFPATGDWTWTVDQDPFAPQELGSISVTAAPQTVTVQRSSQFSLLGYGLAGVLALGVLIWRRPLRQTVR
jgi:hypothetical protein